MMKKLSKLALLAAATALLLAGVTACSDDDDKDPEPGVTIEGGTSVAVGKEITLTAKATDFSGNVTYTWESSDKAKATVTQDTSDLSKATVIGIAEGTAKITVKARAGDTEKTAAVTVTVTADTITPPGDKATAATYSFAGGANGIVAADVDGWVLETKDVINSPAASALETRKLNNGATIAWKGNNAGTLRFRAEHEAGVGDIPTLAPTITALNYNGGQKEDDFAKGVTVSALDRYVSIPVDGAGKITASVKFRKSDNKTGKLQAVLVDGDGNPLGDIVEKDVAVDSEATIEGTTTGATTVILAFSRNNAGGGGIDVTKIMVTPAE